MLLVISLVVIISGLTASCIFIRMKQRELLVKTKGIPLIDCIQHYPIIGAVHVLFGKSIDEYYNYAINLIMASSFTIFKAFVFSKLFIIIKNPEYIQKILSSPKFLEKSSLYSFFPYQTSLFTSKGAMWKTHRKMLNTSFHITLVHKRFVQQFNEAAQILVSDLQCKVGMDLFDIGPIISVRSSDLQLKSIFDADIGKEDLRHFTANIKWILNSISDGMLEKFKLFILIIIGRLMKIDRLEDRIVNKNFKYIEPSFDNARKQYFEEIQANTRNSEENIKIKPVILMHKVVSMLEEGYCTDQSAKDNINFLLIAGSDTMNVAVSNCILCLAMNVDEQEKCAIEIKEVIGDQFDSISVEDLTKLDFLERTINESLRLIPPISVIGRTCDEDFQLDDNKIIPAGTEIGISIITMHRCKEYWGDNPTKFNPDNFLPENVAKRPRLSFLPFSYGPRNCIAKKYAQYALQTYMAHLLVKYKFSTDLNFEDLELGFSLTTVLKNNYMIRIEKR